MRHFSLVMLLLAALSAPALAQPVSEARKYLNGAIALYENLEYEKALKQLTKAKAKASTTDEEVGIALLQGAVLADMGKEEPATRSFKEGFSLDLNAKLPVEVSPKIAALAEKARASVAKVLAPQLEKARAEEEKKKAEAEAAAAAAAEAEAKRKVEQQKAEEEAAARARVAPPPAVEKPAEGPSLRTLALIPAGVAVASAGVATWFLVNANEKYVALDQGKASVEQAAEYREIGKQQATLGYVFAGVAGAGVAAAVTMFALGGSKAPGPAVSAVVTPGGGMVMLSSSVDFVEAR